MNLPDRVRSLHELCMWVVTKQVTVGSFSAVGGRQKMLLPSLSVLGISTCLTAIVSLVVAFNAVYTLPYVA